MRTWPWLTLTLTLALVALAAPSHSPHITFSLFNHRASISPFSDWPLRGDQAQAKYRSRLTAVAECLHAKSRSRCGDTAHPLCVGLTPPPLLLEPAGQLQLLAHPVPTAGAGPAMNRACTRYGFFGTTHPHLLARRLRIPKVWSFIISAREQAPAVRDLTLDSRAGLPC